jgi:hypothetical protein
LVVYHFEPWSADCLMSSSTHEVDPFHLFVNRNDIENVGFWIWLLSLQRKVICWNARQMILQWKRIDLWWYFRQTVLSNCMLSWIYFYCYRVKLSPALK